MSMTPESELGQRIQRSAVISVLVLERVEDAVPLAKALVRGGVDAMELTLRTDAALEGLRRVREEVPEMLAGIGTVLSTEQVDQVCESGATFGVSPGVNPEVIRYAISKELPFGPGVMTPTDIDQSVALGCRLLKYFPASSAGGLKHLGNIAAPYMHLGEGLKFIPLGGVNAANMGEFLEHPLIAAVGGSWLAPKAEVAAGKWDAITRLAEEARQIADDVRG